MLRLGSVWYGIGLMSFNCYPFGSFADPVFLIPEADLRGCMKAVKKDLRGLIVNEKFILYHFGSLLDSILVSFGIILKSKTILGAAPRGSEKEVAKQTHINRTSSSKWLQNGTLKSQGWRYVW